MNLKEERNKDIGSSSIAKLVTSKERIEVRQIGNPLLCGLGLKQVYRILLMNSGKMRV